MNIYNLILLLKILKINDMKIFDKICLIILLALLTNGCQEPEIVLGEDALKDDFSLALKRFESSFKNFERKLSIVNSRFGDGTQHLSTVEGPSNIDQLVDELYEPSLELLTDFGFIESDYVEMFGVSSGPEIDAEIAGLAIMLYALQEVEAGSAGDPAKPMAVECFLEATGIAAGVALVAALSGQAGGKAVRKAFMKALKKMGVRVASGFGLILIAAEFTWCMTR